jgi:hypothetical protein
MGDLVPRKELTRQGVRGVAGLFGGIGVFILRAIASPGVGAAISLPGLIAAGVISLAGLVIATNKEDRQAGFYTVGAGILTAAASLPLLGRVGGFLLLVAGLGLVGGGLWSLLKFWHNLRKRM